MVICPPSSIPQPLGIANPCLQGCWQIVGLQLLEKKKPDSLFVASNFLILVSKTLSYDQQINLFEKSHMRFLYNNAAYILQKASMKKLIYQVLINTWINHTSDILPIGVKVGKVTLNCY